MKLITRYELPLDHGYFRTISPAYKKYLNSHCNLKTHNINDKKFCWIKCLLWIYQVSKHERVDEEPNIEELKKSWMKKWIVIWIPYSRKDIPEWWRKLRLNSHFTTTWFSVVEDEFYYKKWKERGKRARKKFLENPNLRIELVDTNTFSNHYKNAKTKQPYKDSFMRFHKAISWFDEKWDIKNMICFQWDKVLAWLSVINYNWNSSAHLVAFLTNEWKKVQAWTGVIDYRFKMSFENGIKYINFDHLRDKYMTKDQQWYTDFKENFMDYKVVFPDSYFKFV
jgi:hypothetical protein